MSRSGNLLQWKKRDTMCEGVPYFGSVITDSWKDGCGVQGGKGFKSLWSLRETVFLDRNLSLQEKCEVYKACVLFVLVCGVECWIF